MCMCGCRRGESVQPVHSGFQAAGSRGGRWSRLDYPQVSPEEPRGVMSREVELPGLRKLDFSSQFRSGVVPPPQQQCGNGHCGPEKVLTKSRKHTIGSKLRKAGLFIRTEQPGFG